MFVVLGRIEEETAAEPRERATDRLTKQQRTERREIETIHYTMVNTRFGRTCMAMAGIALYVKKKKRREEGRKEGRGPKGNHKKEENLKETTRKRA